MPTETTSQLHEIARRIREMRWITGHTPEEMAGLTEDIDAMPMGLRTPMSPENPNLSGGQKQRVLIARALLPNIKKCGFAEKSPKNPE